MLFSILLSFLLCTSVAAASPRNSPEPAYDPRPHDDEMEPPFPHMEAPLVAAIQLSDSSYQPIGRPVINGQPIKLLSFFSDQHQSLWISVKTTKPRAKAKSFSVSELNEGHSPWLTEGKWKLVSHGSASSLEPPMEICIVWKGFFVVQDATPAMLEGAHFNLPVVNALKTGVLLRIASTTIIPSGTIYIYHHDGPIRKYLEFNEKFISTWSVGDKDATAYKRFPVATLTVAANGPALGGQWRRASRLISSIIGPDMLKIYTKGNELYVQSLTIQRNRKRATAVL